ncbi:hypothetical protein SBOR_4768 [Sclerotinia borealis F-4128]|uniref:Uncharacterized protein n=1 Tax=Sclerotinia borealis (strain F-4128) TaxID=1432307 RepID=W9CDS0_SCLBF|nr:hypothetical protein SBOR_4768 [Sclerotinia borealis F-4128]
MSYRYENVQQTRHPGRNTSSSHRQSYYHSDGMTENEVRRARQRYNEAPSSDNSIELSMMGDDGREHRHRRRKKQEPAGCVIL